MARSMWSGFLSFGLVSVPVGLYTATADQTVHFNQLHKGTSNRIRYKKVDEVTGEEVATPDIVNGFDLGDGEYVVVTREELKEVAPGKSETIEISDFVDLDRIDPVHFRQTYYLAPRGKGADRAYALLLQAMRETSKVGIATLILRDKEHLVAVRPGDDVLILETMYFADEIRSPSEELETLPKDATFAGRELEVAKKLVESLTVDWSPEDYHNTYRARVEELIERKREGQSVVFEKERPKSNVIDLMAALEASVAKTGQARAAESAAPAADQPAGPAEPAAAAGPARQGKQEDLDELTKPELLARAAELDLQGRSKMSKAELIAAIADAGTPGRRGQKIS
jgi:DNA end-binding protein Ku